MLYFLSNLGVDFFAIFGQNIVDKVDFQGRELFLSFPVEFFNNVSELFTHAAHAGNTGGNLCEGLMGAKW